MPPSFCLFHFLTANRDEFLETLREPSVVEAFASERTLEREIACDRYVVGRFFPSPHMFFDRG